LQDKDATIAELLKPLGYATAQTPGLSLTGRPAKQIIFGAS
jgi:hypothetical protein